MNLINFSIVIPVYNTEKYLNTCLNSILDQSYKNFEIILVNDGSTDNSGNICDEYMKMYPEKIKVIHQTNRGQFISRKNGISIAKGDFLLFIDSDDFIRRDSLAIISNIIELHNPDLVMYNFMRVDYYGKKNPVEKYFDNNSIFLGDKKKYIYEKIIKDSSLNNLCNKAVKKELIDIKSYSFKNNYIRHGEDLLQFLDIVTTAKKIIYIDEVLYYYRYNHSSVTNLFDINFYQSAKFVNKELEKYMSIWDMNDEYYKKIFYLRCLNAIKTALLSISKKDCNLNMNEKIVFFRNISQDDFFRKVYLKSDKNRISIRWRIIFRLLYNKKIKISFIVVITYSKIIEFVKNIVNLRS